LDAAAFEVPGQSGKGTSDARDVCKQISIDKAAKITLPNIAPPSVVAIMDEQPTAAEKRISSPPNRETI
jgi:hypothetical protein